VNESKNTPKDDKTIEKKVEHVKHVKQVKQVKHVETEHGTIGD